MYRQKGKGLRHSWNLNADGLYECPYCPYTSKKNSTISEHVSQLHAYEAGRQILPFQCSYCEKQYQAKTRLLNHVRDFHEVVRVQCPECDYSAKNKYALYPHYSVKHMPKCTETISPDKEQCNCCGKILSKMASKSHVATCFIDSPFYRESS